MESLKELYKIGPGPSSSHTIGPYHACKYCVKKYGKDCEFIVDLYGSLSLTGVGHGTDEICRKVFGEDTIVNFHNEFLPEHNNVLTVTIKRKEKKIGYEKILSVGGGSIEIIGDESTNPKNIYKEKSFREIFEYCESKNITLAQYVDENEKIDKYLNKVFDVMVKSIRNGIVRDGVLPGDLYFPRMAKNLYLESEKDNNPITKQKSRISAYAMSVTEENASHEIVVTAPTLGSSGILPAALYYYYHDLSYSKKDIINSLKVAGIFGNIVKTNATISGAQGGCQAEVGVACAMASAAIAYLEGQNSNIISYSAEMGIEHHLGLTCDPVGGYVIIPCIERNGVAVLRAFDNAEMAIKLGKYKSNFVCFDMVVESMQNTGQYLPIELKETGLGGLAKEYYKTKFE